MPCMRFMSCPAAHSGLPKVFSFDSSPGRAIAASFGYMLDERSYRSELKEDRGDEQIYEVFMRRIQLDGDPAPHPEQKVGMITYKKPSYR